jgi:hypothetical protein
MIDRKLSEDNYQIVFNIVARVDPHIQYMYLVLLLLGRKIGGVMSMRVYRVFGSERSSYFHL